jgi:hypothetical protein
VVVVRFGQVSCEMRQMQAFTYSPSVINTTSNLVSYYSPFFDEMATKWLHNIAILSLARAMSRSTISWARSTSALHA